jgi:N-acetylglucosamine kinase-like BadF-type ATPase
MMAERYYLGVDIGGTKSHAMLADQNGFAVGLGAAGPGNHEVVGYDGLVQTLNDITDQALTMAGVSKKDIAGAGFGVAGYDWPSELAPTLEAIANLRLDAPVEAVNDTIVGLVAGAEQGWGVVIVAGTSNNCRGRDRHGREGRVTGNGTWFGEYGGAGELVARALHAVVAEWTRRGPATALTQAFVQRAGAKNMADLLEGIVMGWYELDADLAPLVFQVAHQGDFVAIEAIRWAGEQLGSLAVGVIHQLEIEQQEFDVVLAGSLYKGGTLLNEPLFATVRQVAPGARFVRLEVPPVVGGVLLGMQQAGLEITARRPRLISSAQQLLAAHPDHHAARSLAGKG